MARSHGYKERSHFLRYRERDRPARQQSIAFGPAGCFLDVVSLPLSDIAIKDA
jgi:hypothetical protein